jgi:hypothetical protein
MRATRVKSILVKEGAVHPYIFLTAPLRFFASCLVAALICASPEAFASTLLDEIAASNDGKLPSPIHRLYEIFGSPSAGDHPVFLPQGRSLHRHHTNARFPRMLMAGGKAYNACFVGYSAASDEVESICWDPERRKPVY